MASQEIIKQGRTANFTGGSIRLFLTYDGHWYRVRTSFETFKRVTSLNKAEQAFSSLCLI